MERVVRFILWFIVGVSVVFISFVLIMFFFFINTYREWEYIETKDKLTDEKNTRVLRFINNDKYVYIDCYDFSFIDRSKDELSKSFYTKNFIRVDENKAVEYNSESNNRITDFFNFKPQISQMKQGENMIIRLYDKNKSYDDYKISLKGFKEAYEKLEASCKN